MIKKETILDLILNEMRTHKNHEIKYALEKLYFKIEKLSDDSENEARINELILNQREMD